MNVPASFDAPTEDALKASKEGLFAYENVQHAIEQLYDLRSKVIRIGLLGTLLHRADPDHPDTAAETAAHRATLEREVDQFDRVVHILKTGVPIDGIHPQMARWMHLLALERPADLATVTEVNTLSLRVLKAARDGSADQSAALRAHRRVARQNFHAAITGLCLYMWKRYDKDQSDRLACAQEAAASLSRRLGRMERIGTHVRLVSLNATVEAARIGPEGRGLSLIAQEFKGLAEEVKDLVQAARQDVDTMQGKQ